MSFLPSGSPSSEWKSTIDSGVHAGLMWDIELPMVSIGDKVFYAMDVGGGDPSINKGGSYNDAYSWSWPPEEFGWNAGRLADSLGDAAADFELFLSNSFLKMYEFLYGGRWAIYCRFADGTVKEVTGNQHDVLVDPFYGHLGFTDTQDPDYGGPDREESTPKVDTSRKFYDHFIPINTMFRSTYNDVSHTRRQTQNHIFTDGTFLYVWDDRRKYLYKVNVDTWDFSIVAGPGKDTRSFSQVNLSDGFWYNSTNDNIVDVTSYQDGFGSPFNPLSNFVVEGNFAYVLCERQPYVVNGTPVVGSALWNELGSLGITDATEAPLPVLDIIRIDLNTGYVSTVFNSRRFAPADEGMPPVGDVYMDYLIDKYAQTYGYENMDGTFIPFLFSNRGYHKIWIYNGYLYGHAHYLIWRWKLDGTGPIENMTTSPNVGMIHPDLSPKGVPHTESFGTDRSNYGTAPWMMVGYEENVGNPNLSPDKEGLYFGTHNSPVVIGDWLYAVNTAGAMEFFSPELMFTNAPHNTWQYACRGMNLHQRIIRINLAELQAGTLIDMDNPFWETVAGGTTFALGVPFDYYVYGDSLTGALSPELGTDGNSLELKRNTYLDQQRSIKEKDKYNVMYQYGDRTVFFGLKGMCKDPNDEEKLWFVAQMPDKISEFHDENWGWTAFPNDLDETWVEHNSVLLGYVEPSRTTYDLVLEFSGTVLKNYPTDRSVPQEISLLGDSA